MNEGLIPTEHRSVQDRLDWLDGWHEECGVHFKSKRVPNRTVSWPDPDDLAAAAREERKPRRLTHKAGALLAAGRSARVRHREETGL